MQAPYVKSDKMFDFYNKSFMII